MKAPYNNKRRIIIRYVVFIGLILVFAACIVTKMFKTTVVYARDWNIKADSILTKETIIEPLRGKLLADNGTVLAANMQFYIARVDWNSEGISQDSLAKYLPALCDSLAKFEPSRNASQWNQELTSAYNKINQKGKRNQSYRLIKRLLTTSEYKRLTTFPFFNKGRRKSGLYYERQRKRSKPYGSMAARSIGNVAESTSRSGLHGTSGLEMALDSLLYGIPGKAIKQQTNSAIINGEKVPAVPGYDITTTINVDMQDIVENELYAMLHEAQARWGTAILMEVATGEIKAISNLEWNDAAGDYIEGRNNAVLGYEPGSVMKPISMLVALEDGIVQGPETMITTGHTWTYCGKNLTDHYGDAQLSCEQIIARSSNIGISRIIVRKYGDTPGKFRKRLEELGFFEPFNSGIGGEMQPVVARLGNTNADRVALTRMAFGYTTLIPPLSTLAVFNAIANDGKYVRPHLMKRLSREGEPDSIVPVTYIRNQICSPQNAEKLRQMLHAVVWDGHGTAHRWLQDDRVEIAGKTGTAFTIVNGQYSANRRFAFCGFFPYSKPKYSCMVLLNGGGRGAAASSGVVLKNVALRLYARGLLDNKSDYVADAATRNNGKQPTNKAKIYSSSAKTLTTDLGIKNRTVLTPPKPVGSGVPNVIGMTAREAIATLEQAGLGVRMRGSGYVSKQSRAPGSQFVHGDYITLALSH